VRAGDVVWNPLTGEKALLIELGEETSGERIVADFAWTARSSRSAPVSS